MMAPIQIILDNGHGVTTPGKRSPDGRLLEWQWTRALARSVASRLAERGVKAHLLVPEDADIALRDRVAGANRLVAAWGAANRSLLLSIHVNAAGRGDTWTTACGFLPIVAPGASALSRRMATLLSREARARGLAGNRVLPPDRPYTEQSLAMVRDVACPAVLTENLFMDCRADLERLLSAEGRRALADLHVSAVMDYIKNL